MWGDAEEWHGRGVVMSDPIEVWTSRLRDMTGEKETDSEDARRFVEDLYTAAQIDQDQVRAKAEFEREE